MDWLLSSLLCVSESGLQVKAAWGALAAREGWDKVPVYALGASSGAAMVRAPALAPVSAATWATACDAQSGCQRLRALHLAQRQP